MLSTLICILSLPDALQPTGPALSSLKPAELATATSEPQPPRVNSVALLPLHPASAFTAAPVLTEAAVSPFASTNATATKRSKMKAKAAQTKVTYTLIREGRWRVTRTKAAGVRASSNTTSKPKQKQAKAKAKAGTPKRVKPAKLTTATSQPQPKRLRASSNTTSKPKQRQAKAGAARLARVHGSQRMPGWLIGAFFVGLAMPAGIAVYQHQHRCQQRAGK